MDTNQPVERVFQPAVERRSARFFDVEVREPGQGTGGNYMTLTGYAAVFDEQSLPLYDWWYGEYVERIAPEAFTNALAAGTNVHLVYSHDMASAMASTASETLSLFQDETGLRVVAQLDPADVDVQRVAPKMQRGVVNEMSFAFTVARDQWIVEELADGSERVQRVILEIGELFEASVVPQGAYPQTEAGLRTVRSRIRSAAQRGLIHGAPESREGKVLSAANRDAIQQAVDALQGLLDMSSSESGRRAAARFTELRADIESLEALVEMYECGQDFIALESEPDDGPDRAQMEAILTQLDGLIQGEAAEPNPDRPTDAEGESDGVGDVATGGAPRMSFYGRRGGVHPSGGEPVAPGTQLVGEVERNREAEVMRMQAAIAGHITT